MTNLQRKEGTRLARAWTAACLALAAVCVEGAPPDPAPTTQDDIVVLPQMTVPGESLKDFQLFSRSELTPPQFSEKSAPMDLFYPGQAYADGIGEGNAVVGVMLDADGRATDYLVLMYTQKYFGDALLREAHDQQYAPRRVKGVAVPGRFSFSYKFTPQYVLFMNAFKAIQERDTEIEGGPRYLYAPHVEADIDGGGLVPTKSAVAFIPDGFEAPKGKTVKVFVSFYVDEQGHVRLPSVDSAASPLLIPNAIKAVEHWEFKPPTLRGKPVLVFATWSVRFASPEQPAPARTAPKP